jgi:hypothetical protein
MAMAATAPRARVIMETVALVAPPVLEDEDAAAAAVVEEASEISAEPVRT